MDITVNTLISAPIATVWNFYTQADHIVNWNAASDDWHTTRASVDLRVGGQFSSRMEAKDSSMGFDFAGTYTDVIVNHRIDYQFGERKATVLFDETEGGVSVTVKFEAETVYPPEQQQQGWQAILNNFKRYTEETKA